MVHSLVEMRLAGPADLNAIVEIEVGPDTSEYLGVIGRRYHELALADSDQEHIVAVADETVVGFVVLAGLRTGGGRVELRRIAVSHHYRDYGHGRRLFRAAVARSYAHHGARQMWLDVKPSNARAQALYESEGFVRDGTIPDPTDPRGVLLLMSHTPTSTNRQE